MKIICSIKKSLSEINNKFIFVLQIINSTLNCVYFYQVIKWYYNLDNDNNNNLIVGQKKNVCMYILLF